ncbi:UNVERIFIED_CONTAM: saccharopine dehydrogenase [Mumia flava]|nr:saccharopine dehydrogenase NADP-binding domain-containing protein [Mumia flava]
MSHDIALLGATGFAGRLTAEHLAAHLPDDASWAIAGRSRAKLEAVAQAVADAGGNVPQVVEADVSDATAVRDLAESTRVLGTTVGPYVEYGEAAVAAAAAAGIAYCDLTGEPEFVDRTWLRHHAEAERTGARLVHACGFDSIPYDIGVLNTIKALREAGTDEGTPIRVRGYVRASAQFSGGTYHSAVRAFSRLRESRQLAKQRRAAEPRQQGRRVRGLSGRPERAPDGGYALPLPTLDPQIVLRSARALGEYGDDFGYGHFAHVKRLTTVVGAGVGGAVVLGAAQVPPLRDALLRVKTPGEGPSEQTRAKSWFRVRFHASAGEGSGARTLVTEARGGDPGYTETAVMLGESLMALAYDDVPKVAGQVTTAVAMGEALLERLPYFRTL